MKNKKKVPINTKLTGTDLQAILTFDNTNGEPIIAKVGLSLVSVQNARQNLEAEVKDFDFDAVHTATRSAWEQQLSTITA